MANTDLMKNRIMTLVAEGRADEAWEYTESIRELLTQDELKDMEMWIAHNAYEAFRSAENGLAKKSKWLEIAQHMEEGETLREVLPRLPGELREFLESEARIAKSQKLH